MFFGFLSEQPKIARALARYSSDRETAKTKKRHVFLLVFRPKNQKTQCKTKKPKIQPTPKDSVPGFGCLFFLVSGRLFEASSLCSKPQAVYLNTGPNRQCRAGQSALRMHHRYMIRDKRFPGNIGFCQRFTAKSG